MRKTTKKGFTLIELLAVIVILAIIIIMAVASVGAVLNRMKKNAYVVEANTIVKAAKTFLVTNPGRLPTSSEDPSIIYISELDLQGGNKSPYGEEYSEESYVEVGKGTNIGEYTYSIYLVDEEGNGIGTEAEPVNIDNVTIANVENNVEVEPEPGLNGNDANTLLLLHAEDFTNSSSTTNTITNTNVTLNTTVKHFGSSSFYFNGSSAYLDLSSLISFGSGNFTIDFWVYFLNNTKGYQGIIDNKNMNSDKNSWMVYMEQNNSFQFVASNGYGWPVVMPISSTVTLNTWYHIAIVRNGNNWYIFKDGVILTSITNNTTVISTPTSPIRIGAFKTTNGSSFFNGYVDEIRISNTARWTANFTPPTEKYS